MTVAQGELTLSDYWRILRKRIGEVMAVFLLFVAGTHIYLRYQRPVYRVMAEIKLNRPTVITDQLFGGQPYFFENSPTTEARMIESRLIAERVARRLLSDLPQASPSAVQALADRIQAGLKAEPVSGTNNIRIVVTGPDPVFITELANATAELYIETNLEEKNKQVRKAREFVESQLAKTETRLRDGEDELHRMREQGKAAGIAVTLENRLLALRTQMDDLLPRLTESHPDVIRVREQIDQVEAQIRRLPAAELDFARITRDVEVSEKMYRTLRERLEELRITEAEKIADATLIERARTPRAPLYPRKEVTLGVGMLLGLLVGCVMAFLFEALDTSIGTIEDVERLLQVPVLAVVPHIGRYDDSDKRHIPNALRQLFRDRRKRQLVQQTRLPLYVHYYPNSLAAEAFRILRTNLKLSPERKLILVTSAGPSEGKTTVLSNLGVVIAQAGIRTVLVSGDLRKPALDRVFGLERDVGMTEVLQGTVPVDRALRGLSDFIMGKFGFDETVRSPHLANMFLLTSGRIPENPVELIGSQATRQLLSELRARFDVVLLDAPPLLPIADTLLLAPIVDGVILVYQVGRISRAALLRAKVQLESAGARLLGVVLNHVQPEVQTQPTYYYYRQRYGYQQEPAETSGPQPPPTPSA